MDIPLTLIVLLIIVIILFLILLLWPKKQLTVPAIFHAIQSEPLIIAYNEQPSRRLPPQTICVRNSNIRIFYLQTQERTRIAGTLEIHVNGYRGNLIVTMVDNHIARWQPRGTNIRQPAPGTPDYRLLRQIFQEVRTVITQ